MCVGYSYSDLYTRCALWVDQLYLPYKPGWNSYTATGNWDYGISTLSQTSINDYFDLIF